jgi:C4-type Zn-finger protein
MDMEVAKVDAAIPRPTADQEEKLRGRCPVCGSVYTAKSRVRWWERPFLALTSRRPYRCVSCRWRGWKPYAKWDSSS